MEPKDVIADHDANSETAMAGRGDIGPALLDLLPEFSYPRRGGAAALDIAVPLIAREYAAGVVAAYLGEQFDQIGANSTGLLEYLGHWVANPEALIPSGPTPVPGWDYAFGDIYRSWKNDGCDAPRESTSVAAHLGACGLPGSWCVKLDRPLQLRWSGVLLPAATVLEVESDATRAVIKYAGGSKSGSEVLNRVCGVWQAETMASHPAVSRHGVTIELLARSALAMRYFEDLIERALVEVPSEMSVVLHHALDIVAEYAPEYLPWANRTIHQMFFLNPTPRRVESGSVEHYLGLIHLSRHNEALPVAELLVHEATHQYMNLVAKIQPLDDGSDPNMYWSPAVNTERPVSKIIAALHAFGNVILFYRTCRENGLAEVHECERQEQLLGRWMDHFVPPLVDNPALSQTGNALCQPLLEALSRL